MSKDAKDANVSHSVTANASPAQPMQPMPPAPQQNTYRRPPPLQSMAKLQGIPVNEGETLQDVHPQIIRNWFLGLENRWKQSYANKSIDGQPASMSWTRG